MKIDLTSEELSLARVHPIDAIKAIQMRCGCSLYEAKQAMDAARNAGYVNSAMVRAAALEEAAKVCDKMDHDGVMVSADCAAAIRALKEAR